MMLLILRTREGVRILVRTRTLVEASIAWLLSVRRWQAAIATMRRAAEMPARRTAVAILRSGTVRPAEVGRRRRRRSAVAWLVIAAAVAARRTLLLVCTVGRLLRRLAVIPERVTGATSEIRVLGLRLVVL